MKMGLAVAALVVAGVASTYGTPHVLHREICVSHDGMRHCAYVLSCTYVGIQGYRKIFPEWTGEVRRCPGVQWFPLTWPLNTWAEEPRLLRGEQVPL